MTKKEIIETALREWGKTRFAATNLTAVAEALGVTKTALYRYFDGKEALVRAILEQTVEEFNALCCRFASEGPYHSTEAALHRFFSLYFHHYCSNIEQFFFIMVHATWNRKDTAMPYRKGFGYVRKVLTETMKESAEANFISFIMITAVFWMIKNSKQAGPGTPLFSEEEARNAALFCLRGMSGNGGSAIPSAAELTGSCSVSPEELPESSRFFQAIAQTVTDYGMQNASMDKIARRLNMKKSSLYFHFANKEKMMKSMFAEEQQTMETVYKRHSRTFQDPWGKIFCYAFMATSYLINKPEMIITIGWLRMQFNYFSIKQDRERQFGEGALYLLEPFSSDTFNLHGLDPGEAVFLFNIHVTREIIHSFHSGMEKQEIYSRIHRVCRLFHSGLEGAYL